jgi:hypothetical protein
MANLITEHTEMYSTLIIREPECSGKCCRSDEHILREHKTPFHFDSEKKEKKKEEVREGRAQSFPSAGRLHHSWRKYFHQKRPPGIMRYQPGKI